MDKLFLNFDRSRIVVGTWLAAEAGDVRATRDVVAACMTDAQGNFLAPEDAQAQLNQLTMEDLDEAGAQLLHVIQESAVNPSKSSR